MNIKPSVHRKKELTLNRNIPLLSVWVGQGLSALGSGIYSLALAWEVVRITGSTLAMGTILLVTMLPKIIFSFFGGALGDRFIKKRLLLITDLTRFLLGIGWGLTLLGRETTLMELYLFSIIFGIIQAFFSPAYNALLPELIRQNQIPRAVTINMMVFRLSSLVAPALGGVLVTLLSFGSIVILDSVTYGLAFLCNCLLPSVKMKEKKKEPILTSIRTGIGYFVHHRRIFWSVILITFANVAVVTFSVNLPKFVQVDLHWNADTYGWIVSMFGLGALVSLLVLTAFPLKRRMGLLYLLTLILGGSMLFSIAFADVPIQLGACIFVMGAAFTITSSISTTILQKETDKSYLSRVMGIAGVSSLLTPVGYVLWGAAGDMLGNVTVFVVAGAIVILVGLFGLTTSLRKHDG
ncbi:MFS transporter [Kroppenstedtia guangzhouensis]|uniref:MFS transporter n=1 Tax=Kroppenstedtia guangzhouensis TaxID=1274356 RepID=A0ABQ1H685_9BACL|nr:MFS transporter [Kroppenstedtia guangzhouensis]GGA58750.1 MFS transporter [Kroppenstedtia guangzhouensis]